MSHLPHTLENSNWEWELLQIFGEFFAFNIFCTNSTSWHSMTRVSLGVTKNSLAALTSWSPRPRLAYLEWMGHVCRMYIAMDTRRGLSQQPLSIGWPFATTWSPLTFITSFVSAPKERELCTDNIPEKKRLKNVTFGVVIHVGCHTLVITVYRWKVYG